MKGHKLPQCTGGVEKKIDCDAKIDNETGGFDPALMELAESKISASVRNFFGNPEYLNSSITDPADPTLTHEFSAGTRLKVSLDNSGKASDAIDIDCINLQCSVKNFDIYVENSGMDKGDGLGHTIAHLKKSPLPESWKKHLRYHRVNPFSYIVLAAKVSALNSALIIASDYPENSIPRCSRQKRLLEKVVIAKNRYKSTTDDLFALDRSVKIYCGDLKNLSSNIHFDFDTCDKREIDWIVFAYPNFPLVGIVSLRGDAVDIKNLNENLSVFHFDKAAQYKYPLLINKQQVAGPVYQRADDQGGQDWY